MRRIWLLLGLLPLACQNGTVWPWPNSARELRLTGVVETQEIRLGSKIGGRVEAVTVLEGQTVREGDVLVRFAAPEWEAQVAQAKARLAAAQAAYAKAQNGPRGEEIAAAQAQVDAAQARLERLRKGWREEEIRQAKNELAAAEADLTWARAEFDRVEQLYRTGGSGATTRGEIDLARANRDRALSRGMVAKARYEMMMAGSRPEDIAEAEADARRAAAQLALLQAGTRAEDLETARAEVAAAAGRLAEVEALLGEAVVKAPCVGYVEVVGVRPGDLMPPHQPIVRILRAEDCWVKVFVPETELGKIQKGQTVLVAVDSHPGRRFAGRVIHIAAVSEFLPRNVQSADERRNQMFAVKVSMTEPEAATIFKPGMAAEVFLPLAP